MESVRLWFGGCALAAAATLAAPAVGSTLDPIGDFLSIYVGPQNGDLDVTRVGARFVGTDSVRLRGDHAGPIGMTAGSAYVWGVDRGQGTERLAELTPSVGARASRSTRWRCCSPTAPGW
jgi:hypothetical protein